MDKKPTYKELMKRIKELEDDLKRAEEVIQESKEHYRSFVQNLDGIAYRGDVNFEPEFFHGAVEKMTGYTEQDFMEGKIRWDSIIHKDDLPGCLEKVKERIQDKPRVAESEFRIVHRNGSIRWIHEIFQTLFDDSGQVIGTQGIQHDITERKQAEEAIKENEEKYRSLIESTEDSIYLIDEECRYIFMNKKHLSRFGLPKRKVIGMPYGKFHSERETKEFTKKVHEVFKTGKPLSYEYKSERDGGYYIRTFSPVKEPDGTMTAVTVDSKNITEHKQNEEVLRRRAKEFAALYETSLDLTKPHDLPTLLETIVGRAVQLLNGTSGGMYRCDPDRKEVRCVVSYNTLHDYTGTVLKYGEGAAGTVAQTKEPMIIDDYRTWSNRATVFEKGQPFRTVISVPMIWQDEVFGVIHVLNDVETKRFTQADLKLLTLFANKAVIAIQNSRLVEQVQSHAAKLQRQLVELEGSTNELKKSNEKLQFEIYQRKQAEEELSYSKNKLQIFQKITETVHSTLDEKKVFAKITDGIVYSLEYNAAAIILRNDETHCYEVKTFSAKKRIVTQINKILGSPAKKFSFSGESVPNDAIDTVMKGKTVIAKTFADIAYPMISKSACSGIQALRGSKHYIVVPLKIKGEVVGGLVISSEQDEIVTKELQLLETFAYTASQAITNARLHMETKRAAEAIRENEEHYRELADSITDLFFAVDNNLKYTYWNNASEKFTGIPAKDAIGESLFEIFPDTPETRRAEKVYHDVLKTKKPATYINEYYAEGKRRFFDITAYPSKNGLSVFARDITKQKEAELSLVESEKRYRSLFDGVPVGLYRTTPSGKILDVNTALIEIMGYPNRETILQTNSIESYVNPRNREIFQATIEKKGVIKEFEVQLYRYDRTTVWVEINTRIVKNIDGDVLFYEGSLTDITWRKEAEEKLKESEEFLENVFQAIQDGVSVLDPELNIRKVNSWIEKMYPEHIPFTGKKCYEVYQARQSPCPWCPSLKTLKTGNAHSAIVPYPSEEKPMGWFDLYAYPLKNIEGHMIGVIEYVKDITDRKQAEEALRESEEKYRELANSISEVFFAVDTTLRFTYWNTASERLAGIQANDVIGKSISEIFPDRPETRTFERICRDVLKTQKFKIFTQKYPLKGERRFFDITVYPSRNGLSAFVRDITKQKEVELALWESEKRYRSLFDGVPIGLSRITPNGKVLDANKTMVEILGYPNRETLLHTDTNKAYVKQKDLEIFQKTIKKEGAIYDFKTQLYRYDGTVIWVGVNVRMVKNPDGNILYYEGSMSDITERKKVQEALEASENRFRELFNNMSNGVAVYEPINDGSDFIIKDYNKAGELISKVDKEQIAGKSILEVFPGIKQFGLFKVLQKVYNTGRPEHQPTSLYHDGHLTHWAENYVYKLPSGEIVAVFDDVTKRVEAEEELLHSQEQLRSLANHLQTARENERTTIAREIHDELGQALTGLKMDISWMGKRIPKEQTQLLEKLQSMSELTGNTLRTVQRISTELRPGLLDDLGLTAAIEWQTEEFQNRTGIRCTLVFEPEDITIDDRCSTALFRILQETLTNVVRHAQATQVKIRLKEKDEELGLWIKDNGKGITKEQISDSKSFGITGMRERIQSCGGNLKVSGRPEKGTTVVVSLPIK